MKKTPFVQNHIDAGAKMVDFAGFYMPVEFSGINDEHITVRQAAGVFDVSHMGEIWVNGPKALQFLQAIASNDVSKLTVGKAQYACLPNGKGGIVDDILIHKFDDQKYLLVVNASNTDKDYDHICKEGEKFGLKAGVDIVNDSDNYAQIAVQGPLALDIIEKMCDYPIRDMKSYSFVVTQVAGIPDAIFATTGYTGSGGCEIYVKKEYAQKLWSELWRVGADYGLKNIGLGARDTLRLEKGFCLYGNDIDDTTSPIEAGLGWITKLTDDKTDLIDRAVIERQMKEGVARKLVGFELIDRGIPRHDYQIANAKGEIIGRVTSGTMSPMRKIGIGMGYVATEYAAPDTEIFIIIRDKPIKAKVVKMPFV